MAGDSRRSSRWCRATRSSVGSPAGDQVEKWKAGDIVGVGCIVDSCRECGPCRAGEEQYCEKAATPTYNGNERDGTTPTYGGYSTEIIVDENYVVRIPDGIPLEGAAPLLCAGITTYSPLRHHGVKAGDHVAVVGLGGLGHMGVKLATAMGANVTVLSHSPASGKTRGAWAPTISSRPTTHPCSRRMPRRST